MFESLRPQQSIAGRNLMEVTFAALKLQTSMSRRNSSKSVKISGVKTYRKNKKVVRIEYDAKSPGKEKQHCIIHLLPQLNVKVHCTCGDFRYVWQYAIKQQGGADPGQVDQAPTVTNPAQTPGLCKHLWAGRDIVSKHQAANARKK